MELAGNKYLSQTFQASHVKYAYLLTYPASVRLSEDTWKYAKNTCKDILIFRCVPDKEFRNIVNKVDCLNLEIHSTDAC